MDGHENVHSKESGSTVKQMEVGRHEYQRSRCDRKLVVIVSIVLLSLLILSICLILIYIPSGDTKSKPCVGKEGLYAKAAVASDALFCSKIGTDIMEIHEGSAVDAAIATMICIGFGQVHSAGIGGGFFMSIYDKETQTPYALDAREVAPRAASRDMYKEKPDDSKIGGLSIGVPGELAGFHAAHQKFGKLPWKDLFAPTIKLCENGVPVTSAVQDALKSKEDVIRNSSMLSSKFINPATGELYKKGEKIRYEEMAKTLRKVADEGSKAFYNGSLTEDIVNDINDAGGIITTDDLRLYEAKWRNPISAKLKDNLTMYSVPPPSGGVLLLFILNVIDEFGVSKTSMDSLSKAVTTYHHFIEATKFAYARRAELGDEDFVNITALLKKLRSKKYARDVLSRISDDTTHSTSYYGENQNTIKTEGTSHIAVLAPNGDAVSATSSINFYLGSKVMGGRTGILFNNEMDDFSTPNRSNAFGLPPSPTNFIVPGKRPMSSMSPAIVVDKNGDVRGVIGAAGGSKIISATAYTAMRVFLLEESLKEAIDAPRLHNQWIPNITYYEKNFPKDIISSLRLKGHTFELQSGKAVIEAIVSRKGQIFAYSDERKGGCPDGF